MRGYASTLACAAVLSWGAVAVAQGEEAPAQPDTEKPPAGSEAEQPASDGDGSNPGDSTGEGADTDDDDGDDADDDDTDGGSSVNPGGTDRGDRGDRGRGRGRGRGRPPPKPERVEEVGGARWSGTMGFVQPGKEPEGVPGGVADAKVITTPAPSAATAGAPGAAGAGPATVDGDAGGRFYFYFGPGIDTWVPIEDGDEVDDFELSGFDVAFHVSSSFRSPGDRVGLWLDADWALVALGSGDVGTGSSTEEVSVFSQRIRFRLGPDIYIAGPITAGPFVGFRFDLYSLSVGEDATSESAVNVGYEYGAHAMLDFGDVFIDPRLRWLNGPAQTAQYADIIAGIDVGVLLSVSYTTRLGSSGEIEDAEDAADGFAKAEPLKSRIGVGFGFTLL